MGIYDDIELTPQEQVEAILEGKKKKYFREKNRAYLESQERDKKGQLMTNQPSHKNPS